MKLPEKILSQFRAWGSVGGRKHRPAPLTSAEARRRVGCRRDRQEQVKTAALAVLAGALWVAVWYGQAARF